MATNLPIVSLDSIRDRRRTNRPWPKPAIEFVARKMHNSIRFRHGDIDLRDPKLALRLLDYQVEEDECLGEYIGEDGRNAVAGIIDGKNRIVRLCPSFPSHVRNFTASHELGHAVLHPPMTQHRDRPIHGGDNSVRRSMQEKEADEFAAFFLMPTEQVIGEFRRMFQSVPFIPTEETAFALYRANLDDLLHQWKSTRDGARELAQTTHFDRYYFKSLAERFGVSNEAMAIRIDDLGLVALG